MKKLVILSGGMDSATALGVMVANVGEKSIETITFNYGSKHNAQENKCAKLLADHYGVKNVLVELPFINELFASDLLKSGGEIPEGHYADPSMKRTVVPFRNGIMLAISAGYAESVGAKEIVLGNHSGDHAIYPDCREAFTAPMNEAIKNGTYSNVQILRPFEFMTKAELLKVGLGLSVPYALTYSCYKGADVQCGLCGTCVERKEAFLLVSSLDPRPMDQ